MAGAKRRPGAFLFVILGSAHAASRVLRPRMTKAWLAAPFTHAASRALRPGMTKARAGARS
ncbi:MAG: hypothetical protein E5V92_08070 [Mesorhizobium sp.]|nr:hypothetical protein EJ067_28250 [Mesorhizobium sp. M1D.F.Ca.ET.043.01.1.1]RWA96515.1 MAG: hypothetical protein EOQ32_02615 [Mesorhizobium sp.]RWE17724.1 MAG: hypothetical protein EOS61_02025 [Mesorhizobium sp.]TJW87806.1 MAG: hypothetical protein E5V92_08070 [Mesorhizobium sp.]